MSDRGRKALKAGAWYTVCTFLLRGVSFLTMPLFTRLMSVSEIGYYSNFTSWMSILGGVLTLDLYTSVNLAYYEYDKKISGFMSTIAIAGTVYTFTSTPRAFWTSRATASATHCSIRFATSFPAAQSQRTRRTATGK